MWHSRIAQVETADASYDASSLSIVIPYPRDPTIAMYAATLARAAATGDLLDMPELARAVVYILNMCEELDWDAIARQLDIHAELVPTLRASLTRVIDRLPISPSGE